MDNTCDVVLATNVHGLKLNSANMEMGSSTPRPTKGKYARSVSRDHFQPSRCSVSSSYFLFFVFVFFFLEIILRMSYIY